MLETTDPRQTAELDQGAASGRTPLGFRGGDILIYKSIAVLAGIALPVIGCVNWFVGSAIAVPQLVFAAALLVGALLCWYVSWLGRREISAALLIGVLWSTATIYAFESGYGMHSSAVFIYLPCVLYTAFFFGLAIASAELALTVAALLVMYVAETSGRLPGAIEFTRQGANFNFLLGVILTSVGTLIVSVVYQRRLERDAAAVAGEAERRRIAMEQAQRAQAQVETANARLQALNTEIEAQGRQHALETVRARRDIDLVHDVIARDIPTSIAALRSMLETLDVQNAARLLREISRIEAVVDAVSEFGSRREPGLLRTNVDLSALASSYARELRSRASYARVRIHIDSRLRAHADGEQAAALLQHLIKRACASCLAEPDPLVHVGSGSNDGRAVFFVRDNGPGMDKAQFDALFRPFERGNLDNTMDIGIVSARRIAERHGGELFVESALGQGTTYFFTFGPA